MTSPAGWSRTGDDVVAEIEMAQTNWSGGFLVLEGPSDECFFNSKAKDDVFIVVADGRPNVERAFELMDAETKHARTLALGIVDEDYDWHFGTHPVSPNIVKFDPRDLEGMLIRSEALDAVLAEFADRNTLREFRSSTARAFIDELLDVIDVFARVRFFNAIGPKVELEGFKPIRFIVPGAWAYDTTEILDYAVRAGMETSPARLAAALDALKFPSRWHVCRGHDLVDALVGGLLRALGAHRSTCERHVARVLRQGMSSASFQGTGVYARIRNWESSRGFRMLV